MSENLSPGEALHRRTQCGAVYEMLRESYPRPVPLWQLLEMRPRIAMLNVRILELRRYYDLEIRNRKWREGATVCSEYTLIRDSEKAAHTFGYSNVLPLNLHCEHEPPAAIGGPRG